MKKRPLPPNTILDSKKGHKVFEGKRFEIYQWKQKQFDGSTAVFETAKRNDSVIIIAIINNKIVVVKEQQAHWDKPGINIPAGMVDKGEDLTDAARRELEEETGMIFENFTLVYVQQFVGVEWFAYTFIATGFKGMKEKNLDAGEKNEVLKMSLEKVIKLARSMKFYYPPRFIEHYLIKDDVAGLKKVLENPKKYEIK